MEWSIEWSLPSSGPGLARSSILSFDKSTVAARDYFQI